MSIMKLIMKKIQNNKQPLVCIVTPVFNRLPATLSFLKSLENQSYKNIKIIIVNDGSTDGTAIEIARLFPQVIVIEGKSSYWWSAGTNLGVRYALVNGADYIYTVNNDVKLMSDTIAKLVSAARSSKKTLIGTTIYDVDQPASVWYYGATFNRELGILEHKTGTNLKFSKDLIKSEWLTGMGCLVPISAFSEIGLYDEKHLPQYLADTEFSLRAKRHGYKLVVSTKAVLHTDTESSWVNSDYKSKPWSFLWEIFFTIRSPYELRTRYWFYRNYWGNGWLKAYLRANKVVLFGIVKPFVLGKIGLKKVA